MWKNIEKTPFFQRSYFFTSLTAAISLKLGYAFVWVVDKKPRVFQEILWSSFQERHMYFWGCFYKSFSHLKVKNPNVPPAKIFRFDYFWSPYSKLPPTKFLCQKNNFSSRTSRNTEKCDFKKHCTVSYLKSQWSK